MNIPQILQEDSTLTTKWHNERNDKPIPYKFIVVESNDGRYLEGYITKDGLFSASSKSDVEGLDAIKYKRWRYGMIK